MNLFIDTNVFLDAFLPDRINKSSSQRILNEVSSGSVTAYAASFSIATITYFLQKAFKEDTAAIIEQLLKQIEIIDVGKTDFLAALSISFKDLEDAYQYIAATKIPKADYILTQNVKDFTASAIPTMKPQDFLRLHF